MNEFSFKADNAEDLITCWVEFTYPIHKLSAFPRKVLTRMLYHYFMNENIFNKETLEGIANEINSNLHQVQVILSQMIKHNVIKRTPVVGGKQRYNYSINKTLIPKFDNKGLTIKFNFISNDTNKKDI